jgi:catechol 2,3-dioxygenase-like lactoylglutathione lyase family enzyme
MPEMHLELVPLPVSDIDKAKAFYVDQCGFEIITDHEQRSPDGVAQRVVQLNPPGSKCSVVFGTGMPEISDMTPGSQKALHLVVADMDEARGALVDRGVDVQPVMDIAGVKYAYFADPDGNSWLLQQWPKM